MRNVKSDVDGSEQCRYFALFINSIVISYRGNFTFLNKIKQFPASGIF
jgi:hypothetical protein